MYAMMVSVSFRAIENVFGMGQKNGCFCGLYRCRCCFEAGWKNVCKDGRRVEENGCEY